MCQMYQIGLKTRMQNDALVDYSLHDSCFFGM